MISPGRRGPRKEGKWFPCRLIRRILFYSALWRQFSCCPRPKRANAFLLKRTRLSAVMWPRCTSPATAIPRNSQKQGAARVAARGAQSLSWVGGLLCVGRAVTRLIVLARSLTVRCDGSRPSVPWRCSASQPTARRCCSAPRSPRRSLSRLSLHHAPRWRFPARFPRRGRRFHEVQNNSIICVNAEPRSARRDASATAIFLADGPRVETGRISNDLEPNTAQRDVLTVSSGGRLSRAVAIRHSAKPPMTSISTHQPSTSPHAATPIHAIQNRPATITVMRRHGIVTLRASGLSARSPSSTAATSLRRADDHAYGIRNGLRAGQCHASVLP